MHIYLWMIINLKIKWLYLGLISIWFLALHICGMYKGDKWWSIYALWSDLYRDLDHHIKVTNTNTLKVVVEHLVNVKYVLKICNTSCKVAISGKVVGYVHLLSCHVTYHVTLPRDPWMIPVSSSKYKMLIPSQVVVMPASLMRKLAVFICPE